MNTSREFGPGLKARRERRGITLEAIASATKIGRPLLAGLERNDLSHWPKGIFRRAFFRDYAAAIGAPVDETLAEFMRFFPESGSTSNEPPSPLRMTLAPGRSRVRMRATHGAGAMLDAFVVASIGLAAAWWLGVERLNAIAVAALIYYPLTAAWLGRGLAVSWLSGGQRLPDAWRRARSSSQHAGAPGHTPAEPIREPEPQPVAKLLGLRKGSAA
ncbi:MAG TPA: helix-turn-helix domain-containing protein [Vicinamibacterales bacterium]